MTLWRIDPDHTRVMFSTRHMAITTVRGHFSRVHVTRFEYNPAKPTASRLEVEIDAASVHTGVADRDAHLRSADFFDVERFPVVTFVSTNIQTTGRHSVRITGDLTIRGIRRAVAFEAEFVGEIHNPYNGARVVGFAGSTTINREAWGLLWNIELQSGGVLVGRDIRIELALEAEEVRESALALA